MENNRIKESISAVNQSLGIDLEVIVNDAQLESQKKFKLTYEKVLTALLIKWMRNDTNVKLLKLYLAIENTLYLCIKDKINNEKSYRLYSCFY